jgi:hypothetical protein
MRLKSVFVIIAVVVYANLLHSQTVMEFTDVKDAGDLKTVYFQVTGLGDDDDARTTLLNEFLSDPLISDGRIFTNSSFKTRCQLFISYNMGPEYIRPILQSKGYDFEFSSVTIDGNLLVDKDERSYTSMFYAPADDFPSYEKTGDKELDDETYRKSKEEWIELNQRKYRKGKSNGTAELPIIISQEQFDSFTEEKQLEILGQPDVFEIK